MFQRHFPAINIAEYAQGIWRCLQARLRCPQSQSDAKECPHCVAVHHFSPAGVSAGIGLLLLKAQQQPLTFTAAIEAPELQYQGAELPGHRS